MTARKTTKTKTKSTSSSKRTTKTTAKKKTSKEDRDGHRVPIQLLVDYKSEGHYLFDFCKDLSSGGVFIQTKAPLSQGSDIELTFTIPDSKETLNTKGKVIWVQTFVENREDLQPGMGVQFDAFSEDQRVLLNKFVSRYHGDKLTPLDKDKAEAAAS
jgi:type IV pilus assembly protein PilZ